MRMTRTLVRWRPAIGRDVASVMSQGSGYEPLALRLSRTRGEGRFVGAFARALSTLFMLTVLSACEREVVVLAESTATGDAYAAVAGTLQDLPRTNVLRAAYQELIQRSRTDLASETGAYDIILGYNQELPLFARQKWIVPVDEYGVRSSTWDSTFRASLDTLLFERTWREVGFYGRAGQVTRIGVPFSANTMLLAYNARLLRTPRYQEEYRRRFGDSLRVPTTWNELRRQVEFFHRPDRGIYGIAMQGQAAWIYYEWANLAFSHGGGVMRKSAGWDSDLSTPLTLTDSSTVAGTQEYLRLVQYDAGADRGIRSRSPYDGRDAAQQVQLLEQDNIAFGIIWSDEAFRLRNASAIDFAPIPGDRSMLAGGSFFISRFTKQPDNAIAVVQALLSTDAQRQLMLKGLCSPVRSVYNDSTVLAQIRYAPALRASLERGVYMLEAGPDTDVIIEILSRTLQRLARKVADLPMGQSLSPQEIRTALGEATAEIEARRKELRESASQSP